MDSEVENGKNSHVYRRFFAQFIAITVNSMIMFDTGACSAIPAIVIPALTGIRNEHNQHETFTITDDQASWLAAVMSFSQPIACILSGPLTDPIGRKLANILVNTPFIIGWYFLYRSTTVWDICIGFAMLGFGTSVMDAPVIAVRAEVTETKYRGMLIGYSFVCLSIGGFTVFQLNTMMAWRSVCLIGLTIPIITVLAMCFIPETPHYLLSKNRTAEAERSLRWFRGWVSSEVVAKEFDELKRYSKLSKSCITCTKQNLECTHPLPTMSEKFAEMKRKQTLKPLFIVVIMFFLSRFVGQITMNSFMIQIFKAYDSPIPAEQAATIMSVLQSISNVLFILLIRLTGKRRFYLFSVSVVLICATILTWFGFTYLPPGYISFDQANREEFHLENRYFGYIPLISLLTWTFFSNCSVVLPWLLLSEIFPFKTRGVLTGVAACINYFFSIICIKSYYNMEMYLSLPGATMLHAVIIFFGLIIMYNILPETENRSLEDIELHFADNSKKITDWKIARSNQAVESVKWNKNSAGRENDGLEIEKV